MPDQHEPPFDEDNSRRQLISTIRGRLERPPPECSKPCIYAIQDKVPKAHREAFSPIAVCIGPFHHGKDRKDIKEHKWGYLKSFLNRTSRPLEDFVATVLECVRQARQCYSRKDYLSLVDFAKMVLLDGAFIIELFLLCHRADMRAPNDFLFEKKNHWILTDIRRDLSLLENQLPFFVLRNLYDLAFEAHSQMDVSLPTLLQLTYKFFEFEGEANTEAESLRNSDVKHFLDAVRLLYLPSAREHLYGDKKKIEAIPSATELKLAGVRFKPGESNCRLFDVKFKKGVLRIPCFKLSPATETLIRNLMVFEQSHHNDDSYSIDYITFMAGLIKTRDDAKLLTRKNIINIHDWLENEETLVALFNSFSEGTVSWTRNVYFSRLREELRVYFRTPLHKLRNRTRDSSEKRKNDV